MLVGGEASAGAPIRQSGSRAAKGRPPRRHQDSPTEGNVPDREARDAHRSGDIAATCYCYSVCVLANHSGAICKHPKSGTFRGRRGDTSVSVWRKWDARLRLDAEGPVRPRIEGDALSVSYSGDVIVFHLERWCIVVSHVPPQRSRAGKVEVVASTSPISQQALDLCQPSASNWRPWDDGWRGRHRNNGWKDPTDGEARIV